MNKILLSKQKIYELKKQLVEYELALTKQTQEQVEKGGASDSWHETAAFGATRAALESKVNELRRIIDSAKILPDKIGSNEINLGSRVEIKNEKEKVVKYRLVHPLEADPEKGLISIESPLGKLLIGKKQGEIVKFNERELKVKSIVLL